MPNSILGNLAAVGGSPEILADSFEMSVTGLGRFLAAQGVKSFSAKVCCAAHRPLLCASLYGSPYLLGPRDSWTKLAYILLLLESCRDSTGPIRITSWYRPASYNKAVGGASGSDHLTASAVDAHFSSILTRKKAQAVIEEAYKDPHNCISLGVGTAMLHVGAFSPLGHRRWAYDSKGHWISVRS